MDIAALLSSPVLGPKVDLRSAAWTRPVGGAASTAGLLSGAGASSVPTGFSSRPSAEATRAVGGGFTSLVQGLLAERATMPVGGGVAPKDDSLPISNAELHGQPDGPPLQLPSGVIVQKEQVGNARVSGTELQDAVRGIVTLPEADQALIAGAGVQVHLLPVSGLEDNLLGATTIIQDNGSTGPWRPTLVRVAVRAGLRGDEQTSEIVQHELGHVVSVERTQDRSERAAEGYAHTH